MPLTPNDVSKKRFTPVRLREGYDQGEVDQFLDEVEAELTRLLGENDDLRSKLTAAGVEPPAPTPSATTAASPKERAKTDEKPAAAPTTEQTTGPATAQAAVTGPAEPVAPGERPVRHREEIVVSTAAEASAAATRLLELATRNADEVVAEATEEAEKILSTARTDAERLESEVKDRTDKLHEDARTRASALDAETESRRAELLGEIQNEKGRLDGEVENLRSFEREYRSRLKSYFHQQLAALDGRPEDDEPEKLDG